jgi:ATP-dependent DNA helicase RecQ
MNPPTERISAHILATVRRYWGFSELRPLQEQAIRAGLEQRDSLVVMPTGGGKSLCYQVPPALAQRTDIVVSPLISLMKDQVDGLRECGYPAAALYSGMSPEDLRQTEEQIAAGRYRLVFVAPERLLTPRFLQFVERLNVHAFAVDEAHCISHWGHDFRPEYRQLAELKSRFPKTSLHAYTATATERVRADIAAQLRLKNPVVLVGIFDRPNLVYRVVPRVDARAQALEVLRRHPDQAAIVYCITRNDTESMATFLQANRLRAAFYHAGMEADERRRTQDAFASEEIDVVAATVAFGMGIDRSDVRCVIHAAMPKSIEHYQQETGRAGRDGLDAECV